MDWPAPCSPWVAPPTKAGFPRCWLRSGKYDAGHPTGSCPSRRRAGAEGSSFQAVRDAGRSDDETRLASIWSLSQIGGEGVQLALEKLYRQSDSEEDLAFLDEALDNLEYTEEVRLMPILDFRLEMRITGELEEDEELPGLVAELEEFDEEDDDEDEPD